MSTYPKIADSSSLGSSLRILRRYCWAVNPAKRESFIMVYHYVNAISSLFCFQRITIREIRNHPWFLKNLPRELTEAVQAKYYKKDNSAPTFSDQTVEEIMKIVEEARTPPQLSTPVAGFGWAEEDEQEDGKKPDDEDQDGEEEEEEYDGEDEYDKQVKQVHASGDFRHLIKWSF